LLLDRAVIWLTHDKATEGSIAIDARGEIMLVAAKFWYNSLPKNTHLPRCGGLYECLLGISKETGGHTAGSPQAAEAAVINVVQKFCVVPRGFRTGGDWDAGGFEDSVDEELLAHLKDDNLLLLHAFAALVHKSS
jgi:hypothetical protein